MTPAHPHDDIGLLFSLLPLPLQHALSLLPREQLLEIVLDLGRVPQARLRDGAVMLGSEPISHDQLQQIVGRISPFDQDNRAGIEGTLHRLSALRNRRGEIVGLTLRVGRAVIGTIGPLRDLVERGASLLLLGRPGVGKTTRLREVARFLADELGRRVMVVDTSNEIGGDGDIPHPAIGCARRIQVPTPEKQHAVMVEAVENHMPEVIIIDEIGTAADVLAARTIAERGVQLIGTAHGNTLANLLANPTLCDLIGGVQTVTLGDEMARLRGTQKTILERKGPATFDCVVELISQDELLIHADSNGSVDALLRGESPPVLHCGDAAAEPADGESGVVQSLLPRRRRLTPSSQTPPLVSSGHPLMIYPYGVDRDLIERVLRDLRLHARTVRRVERANLILALREQVEDQRLLRMVQATGIPVYFLKRNSTAQIRHLLQHNLELQGVAANGTH